MARYNVRDSLPTHFKVGDEIYMDGMLTLSWNPYEKLIRKLRFECYGEVGASTNRGSSSIAGMASGTYNVNSSGMMYCCNPNDNGDGYGSGGGRSSYVQVGGTNLNTRIIVAGGSGGSGYDAYGGNVNAGGQSYGSGTGGGAGTSSSGGAAGEPVGGGVPGYPGGWGYAGRGGNYTQGGGGGNGYYGGGGGCSAAPCNEYTGAGGGGGSNYTGGVYSAYSGAQNTGSQRMIMYVQEAATITGSISGSTSHTDAPTGSAIQRRLTSGAEIMNRVEVYIDSVRVETSYNYSNYSWYNINIPEQSFYNLSYGSHTLYVRYFDSSNMQAYENTHSFYKNSVYWYITPSLNSAGYVAAENIPFTMSGAKASRIDVRLGSYSVGSFYNMTSGASNTISVSSSVFNGLSVGNHNLEFKIYRGSTLETTINHTYKKINFNGDINGIISGGYTETIPENTIQRRLTAGTGVNRVEVYIGSTRIETSTDFALNTWYNINIPESTFYTLPYGNNTLAVKYLNSSGSLLYQNTATIKKNTINWAINITLDPEGYSAATELDFYMTGAKATKIEAYLGDTLVNTFLDVAPSTQLTIDGITTEIFKALTNGDNTLSFKIYRGTQLEKTLNFTYLKVPYRGSITGIVSEGYIDTPTGIKRILTVGEDITSVKNYINDTLLSTSNSCSLNTLYNFDIPNDVFYHLPDGDHTIKVKYFDNTDTEVFETTATIKKNPVDFNINTTINPDGYYAPEPFNITLTGTSVDKIEVLLNDSLIGALNDVEVNTPIEVNLITREVFRTIPEGENNISFKIYRGTKLEATIGNKTYLKKKPQFDIIGYIDQNSFEEPPIINYTITCNIENISPDKISVYLGEELIDTFTEKQNSFTLNNDLFVSLDNAPHKIKIEVENEDEVVKSKIIGVFRKSSTRMTIISKPILIPSHAVTLSLDMDIQKTNEEIKILACNNAYDAEPVWEDIKNHVFDRTEFILLNSIKEEENNWGFSVKIIAPTGPFKMSETIIGGYQSFMNEPQTFNNFRQRINFNDERSIKKLNMKITILENQFLLGIDIDIEKKTNYFKEYYNKKMLTDKMIERLKGIGIDVTI